jgi:hypothetical protein
MRAQIDNLWRLLLADYDVDSPRQYLGDAVDRIDSP